MAVKMRLQRKGRKQAPFYHIVIADARSPRDGKYIERIGFYNPLTKPATIDIDRDKAFEWLANGAQPTETVRAILRFKGVFYKKHLMRGVKKGALTVEEAENKYQQWVDSKDAKIAARVEQTAKDKADFYAKLSGTPAPKVVEVPVVVEAVSEVEETVEAVEVVETPAAAEEEE